MARVELAGATVTFRVFDAGQRSFKRWITPLWRPSPDKELEIAALRDVDLLLEPGSKVAILGANSAGKTTLLRTVAGLVAPCRGTVRVEGIPGTVLSMGFGVDPEATLSQLAFAQGLLAGLGVGDAHARAEEILDFAEIRAFADSPGHVAPPGILNRLGIAAILIHGADVLLLDEVLENMDPRLYGKYEEAILARVAAGGILLMVDRSRTLLSRFCDEALLMDEGRITARLPLAEALTNSAGPLTF